MVIMSRLPICHSYSPLPQNTTNSISQIETILLNYSKDDDDIHNILLNMNKMTKKFLKLNQKLSILSKGDEKELEKIYAEKTGKYKELKEMLIEDLEKFIKPLREKRKEFAKDIPKALSILKAGGEKAKKVAVKKMEEVREKIGVKVY